MENLSVAPGTLYVVATPIGHREDITLRALNVLKQVDFIAAEDTRHSQGLLAHYGIKTPLRALHEHNEEQQVAPMVRALEDGQSIALISDAGTPLISDPGYKLVNSLRDAGCAVVAVPGACAAIAALSVAGLPTDRFSFIGFLPAKSAGRRKALEALLSFDHTLVFYESPHRIEAMVADVAECFGEKAQLAVVREITKRFETVLSGTVSEVAEQLSADPNQRRGEFVVLLRREANESARDHLAPEMATLFESLLPSVPAKQLAKLFAKATGVDRRVLYDHAVSLKDES